MKGVVTIDPPFPLSLRQIQGDWQETEQVKLISWVQEPVSFADIPTRRIIATQEEGVIMRRLNRLLPDAREGAYAGHYLVGMSDYNLYVIVKLLEDQPPGQKQLVGHFLLLQAGIGHYAEDLKPLVGQQLTALEVNTYLKDRYPEKRWVHVLTPDQLAVVPPLPTPRKRSALVVSLP